MKKYYCIVCGREHNGKHSSKYCRKHMWQLKKYRKILDNNPRTKFDPNEFRFIGNDVVEFDTYKMPTLEVDTTYKIDAEDYPLVAKYHWHTNKAGYASTGGSSLLLHRLLLNAKPGQQVDHINLDITDNRKVNLRIADNSLNSSNRHPYNKLSIKGVEYHEKINSYSAYFRIDNKQYHSKCYKTKEEAAFARFILEQMFRKEPLTQFNNSYINSLTEEQKQKIIKDTELKFNVTN